MSTVRYPVKREHWREPPYMLPSGLWVIPQGRRSIMCEMGFHKFITKTVFGVPYLVCTRCGYIAPKPVLEHTATKKELIIKIQKEMDKQKPTLPTHPVKPDELKRAKEKLIERVWEEYQSKYKKKRGKLIKVGEKR